MIGGFLEPTDGKVLFRGRDITGIPAHGVAHLGIARVFQQSLTFGELSPLDGAFIGCQTAYRWLP